MKKLRTLILASLILALLVGGGGAVYVRMREPARYIPPDEIAFVPQPDSVTPTEPGERALLPGATWVPQTFNNCGPATTSMILQYFGHTVSQE
jgi:hypothetical protein